jgi:hypothetical protein
MLDAFYEMCLTLFHPSLDLSKFSNTKLTDTYSAVLGFSKSFEYFRRPITVYKLVALNIKRVTYYESRCV